MTRTYLVAINQPDDVIDLTGEAFDIKQDLEKSGHDVASVRYWGGPTLSPPNPQYAPPTQPPIQ